MENVIIYDFLMIVMFVTLYKTGRKLETQKKFISKASFMAILVYTLNEGLRFGRGIDYNHYWVAYDNIVKGVDYSKDFWGFYYFAKFLTTFDFSYQVCVLILSFIFIISSLFLLQNYKGCIKYILPFWILFSFSLTENVFRWYMGVSFILVGLAILQQRRKNRILYYSVLSILGCSIHYALIPVPFVFLILNYIKRPLLAPRTFIISAIIVAVISQFSSFSGFVNAFELLASPFDRYSGYADNADFWLTKASHIGGFSSVTGVLDYIMSMIVLIIGYTISKDYGKKYVFMYNLFLISFIFRPLTAQMELLNRYDSLFYSFRAFTYAIVLREYALRKVIGGHQVLNHLFIIIVCVNFIQPLILPFKNDYRKYLYVWSSGNLTAEKMYVIYSHDRK